MKRVAKWEQRGGCVSLSVKTSIHSEKIESVTYKTYEQVVVKISNKGRKKGRKSDLIISAYLHIRERNCDITDFICELTRIPSKFRRSNIRITGDFNAYHHAWLLSPTKGERFYIMN